MKNATRRHFKDFPKKYANLCHLLLPRPIHDNVDYANVSEMTDAMALWQDDFTKDQRDYFELLCTLLEEYDKEHVKWPAITSIDALKHLMAEHEMNAADLSRVLGGSRNLGAMILRGERNLTLEHIRKLGAYFGVGVELFV